MDKENIKGKAKKAEGEIKETVGEVTDNEKLEREGKADKVEGEARDVIGKVKDAFS